MCLVSLKIHALRQKVISHTFKSRQQDIKDALLVEGDLSIYSQYKFACSSNQYIIPYRSYNFKPHYNIKGFINYNRNLLHGISKINVFKMIEITTMTHFTRHRTAQ